MRAYEACKALSTARGEAHYLVDMLGHYGDPSGHPTVTVKVTALTEVHEKCGRKVRGGGAFGAVAETLHRARFSSVLRRSKVVRMYHKQRASAAAPASASRPCL